VRCKYLYITWERNIHWGGGGAYGFLFTNLERGAYVFWVIINLSVHYCHMGIGMNCLCNSQCLTDERSSERWRHLLLCCSNSSGSDSVSIPAYLEFLMQFQRPWAPFRCETGIADRWGRTCRDNRVLVMTLRWGFPAQQVLHITLNTAGVYILENIYRSMSLGGKIFNKGKRRCWRKRTSLIRTDPPPPLSF
jgi:hypothetical protein